MNELLVKDLLPDLEKATDVRQRVEEVRKKKPQQTLTTNPGWIVNFSNGTSASWPAYAIQTTSVALPAPASLYSIASLTPQQFNQYEQLLNQYEQLQNSTFSQMPMPSGGINIRASEPTGILDVLGSWFSK